MVYRQLATAYTNLGINDKAGNAYAKILGLRPNDIEALNNLAYILAEMLDKPEEALGYIERALQQNPREPNILDTHGWILLKTGQVDRAIAQLRRSVDIHASAINYYHLGIALEEARDYRRAMEKLRQAETLLANDATTAEEIGADLRARIEKLEKIVEESTQ